MINCVVNGGYRKHINNETDNVKITHYVAETSNNHLADYHEHIQAAFEMFCSTYNLDYIPSSLSCFGDKIGFVFILFR